LDKLWPQTGGEKRKFIRTLGWVGGGGETKRQNVKLGTL
jgi:hypothetical protein